VGNVDTGRLGEEIAADYLRLAGYDIIAKNFRFGHLEIDIVARDSRCTAFVEVKTRRSSEFGEAVESVGGGKIRNIERAASFFLSRCAPGAGSKEFRIDLIAIDVDIGKGRLVLEHLRGIG